MSNPVGPIPGAQIPPITEKLSNQDGTATSSFYRFFNGIFLRTGGVAGVSAGDAAQVANQAIVTANQATQQSQHALAEAQQALAGITAVESQVATAVSTANQAATIANGVQGASLQRFNNLGDLLDVTQARINLGLEQMPCVFQFDTLPSGLRRGVPLLYKGRIEANLVGTQVWWDVSTTNDAVFTVSYVRGRVDTRIGTITLVNAGAGVQFSLQGAVNLQVGDTLVVQTPSVIDTTLLRVAITLPLSL